MFELFTCGKCVIEASIGALLRCFTLDYIGMRNFIIRSKEGSIWLVIRAVIRCDLEAMDVIKGNLLLLGVLFVKYSRCIIIFNAWSNQLCTLGLLIRLGAKLDVSRPEDTLAHRGALSHLLVGS